MTATTKRRSARRPGALLVGAVGGALVLLTACGSSSSDGNAVAGGFFNSSSGASSAPGGNASSAPASTAPSSPAAPAKLDACALLTKAEAEALAGTPLDAPVPAGAAGGGDITLCQFTGPTTGPTAQVEVFVGDGAKKQLDIDKDTLMHAFTTVPGIGDQCLQEDDNIFVQKNGTWASINLVLLNDASQNVQPLQTAIKLVASRL
jgi:hypothetical protein